MEVSRGSSETSWIRRWLEAIAFVGLWIAAGSLLNLSANVYLLLGIPLAADAAWHEAFSPFIPKVCICGPTSLTGSTR